MSTLVTGLLVAPLAVLTPHPAMADTTPAVNWAQTAAQGPSGRESSYMDYDSTRHRTVLFGGAFQGTTSNTFFSDTWEYDGSAWTQIPTASTPPAGALGQMVFDAARGVSVLFGGGDNASFLAPITWEWNGTTWTPRFTTHRPPVRIWFGMTYDSTRHVVVLFGGDGVDAGGNHTLLNDTWEYDGNDWRQVLTAHSPSGRYGHALAYDSGRGKTVLFAGHDDTTGRLDDTWEYNGTDWTQVAATNSPAARFWHSMAYVAALGKVVVFGGDYFVPSVTLGPNNETWLYDGTGWQQLSTVNKPSPRVMAPVVYDSANSSLVLFGGSTEVNPIQNLADTWALVVPESAATLSVSSLQFPQEPVLSLTTNDVTLTNTGAAPLDLSSVAATGDFGEVDNCPRTPATLATGSACTITVKFTPSSGDVPSAGTLTLTDNVPGGSQSIPLSGSGAWGQMQASSEPLAFGASDINPSGATAIAIETLTFPGPATIVTGFRADIPFFVNNVDCPLSHQLSSGASCHVQVGFDPTIAGNYSGQFAILDNEPGLRHPIGVSGTANPIPVAITLNVTPTDPVPTFGRLLDVTATSSSPFGTATFSLNGHQVGAPVDLGGSGSAFVAIPLDDTTIPAGAGTYSLLVTVHPTDGVHSDSAVSQSVTVFPAATQISSTGTGLAVQGTAVTLAATVSVPPLQSQFDYAANPVWVRFDVIDGAGTTRTYYARVSSAGSASVAVTGLTPGAYSVRGRLVGTSGSLSPNPYLTSEDLRSAFAVEPVRGGFVAGAGPGIAFEFAPGGIATGSLQWVENVQAPGPDGQQHDAYRIITSTSIGSVTSHSHIATVNGSVSIVVVDATTGVQFSATAAAFQLTVAADGSVLVTTNGGASASLPPGSAVNHL